jgi:hypothetical protein
MEQGRSYKAVSPPAVQEIICHSWSENSLPYSQKSAKTPKYLNECVAYI